MQLKSVHKDNSTLINNRKSCTVRAENCCYVMKPYMSDIDICSQAAEV